MLYLHLAWRYATRRLVNYIALCALALALAVQITAMAVLDGMLVDLSGRLRNLGEQITLRAGVMPGRDAYDRAAAALVREVRGVQGVTPMMQRVGFIEGAGGAEYVWIQGIDLDAELRFSSLSEHLLDYRPDPANPQWEHGAHPSVYVGEQLAKRLGIRAGMNIELFNARRGDGTQIEVESRLFTVRSLFRSGVFEKDRYGIYAPIEEAADFYYGPDARDNVETFVLWLKDPNEADALAPAALACANRALGADYNLAADTWQQRWEEMAQGMKHENDLMELVLFLNDAASGFCVFAILVTLVSRRMRDVGLLRCIGASRAGIAAIFIITGAIIGAGGGLLGTAAGCWLTGPITMQTLDGQRMLASGGAVAASAAPGEDLSARRPRLDRWYESVTSEPLYPPRMFGVASEAGLPAVIYPWKLALYFAAAVLVSVGASLYPALWAAWREPMTALREG